METGFIYLWFDRKHKRYYVGCHMGAENDGYVCSSSWMKKAYKRRPEDFRRKILEKNITRELLYEREHYWLSMIKQTEIGSRYYNLSVAKKGHWNLSENKDEINKKRKLAISAAIRNKWQDETYLKKQKGISRPHSESHRESMKGKVGVYVRSEEHKQKLKGKVPWNKGMTKATNEKCCGGRPKKETQ